MEIKSNFFLIILSMMFFSCINKENRSNQEKGRLIKNVSVYEYKHTYNEKDQLISSICEINHEYYFSYTNHVHHENYGDDILIYNYDEKGKLISKEKYHKEDNELSEVKLYKDFCEVVYQFSGADTLSYQREAVDANGNLLIYESKKSQFGDLPPSHTLSEFTYDNMNRCLTYLNFDLLNNDSLKLFYKYYYVGDTLIAEAYDESQQLVETSKSVTDKNTTRKHTYNRFNQLTEEEVTYKEGERITLITSHNYEYNSIDSLFYNHEGHEQKYINIFDGSYTSITKTYNDKGDIIREEMLTIHENNPQGKFGE